MYRKPPRKSKPDQRGDRGEIHCNMTLKETEERVKDHTTTVKRLVVGLNELN